MRIYFHCFCAAVARAAPNVTKFFVVVVVVVLLLLLLAVVLLLLLSLCGGCACFMQLTSCLARHLRTHCPARLRACLRTVRE
eukprot:SAG11_NODE_909_length_6586_cov_11.216433_7_plen_82_part_00